MKNKSAWYFLSVVIIAYITLFIFDQSAGFLTLNFFINTFIKIIPTLIFVFILMALTNYFISPKFVIAHLNNRGFKKWFFVIISGILSSGPVYMWYPLLADLKNKGLNPGLMACFLYNRAIKIPLLPFAFFYFGVKLVLVLTLMMILASIVQGLSLNKLIKQP